MKKFLLELLFYIFLPIISIAIVAEYSIRQIPNDYSYKNKWMEKNSNDLNILCLGPSSVYYGIDPTYFDKKGFNGAHVSQSLNYDKLIIDKFINQMDSLDFLVLGVDYWSPFASLEVGAEWWRAKNYSIYYDRDYHNGEIKYNYELAIHKVSTFKDSLKGLLTMMGLRDESNINVNNLGFGINYSKINKKEDWDNGKAAALRQNMEIESGESLNLIDKNRYYINDICKKCADKNIKVLIITTPTYKSYRANLDNYFLKKKNNFCFFYANKFANVSYIDYSDDVRFVDEDFYDGYHLNEIGAKKLTKIINSKIQEWE